MTEPSVTAIEDITADPAIQCPFPIYDKLRAEDPVYFFEKGGFYVISRHEDIRAVLANPRLFSSDSREYMGFGPKTNAATLPERALIIADPPQHERTRSTVEKAFTIARVNAMEPKIQAIVDEIFAGFIDKGRIEAFSELAMPIPIFVIAGELGIPRSDYKMFKHWSDAIASAFNQGETPEEKEKYAKPISDFNAYILAKRAEKIAAPAQDMISVLAVATPTAVGAETGTPLTDGEFLSITQQLLVGGNETTTALILSSLKTLATDPDMFARINADRKLIKNFIEETLRLQSPVQGFYRVVTRDTTLAGVALAKGSLVHIRYGSANRDPAMFECPNDVNLERRNAAQHLAFGGGAHHCIGQMLARKEASCVLRALLDRVKTLELAPEDNSRYVLMFNMRSLDSLQLVFTKQPAAHTVQ